MTTTLILLIGLAAGFLLGKCWPRKAKTLITVTPTETVRVDRLSGAIISSDSLYFDNVFDFLKRLNTFVSGVYEVRIADYELEFFGMTVYENHSVKLETHFEPGTLINPFGFNHKGGLIGETQKIHDELEKKVTDFPDKPVYNWEMNREQTPNNKIVTTLTKSYVCPLAYYEKEKLGFSSTKELIESIGTPTWINSHLPEGVWRSEIPDPEKRPHNRKYVKVHYITETPNVCFMPKIIL